MIRLTLVCDRCQCEYLTVGEVAFDLDRIGEILRSHAAAKAGWSTDPGEPGHPDRCAACTPTQEKEKGGAS